jgi:hypothetical protein
MGCARELQLRILLIVLHLALPFELFRRERPRQPLGGVRLPIVLFTDA